MKRKFLLILSVLLLTAICLSCFTACHSTKKIDKFGKKITEGKNYELSITMEIPLFGSQEMTYKMDGNKFYEFISGEGASFAEIVGDKRYVYTKENGEWTKQEEDYDEKDMAIGISQMGELFNGSYYEWSRDRKAYVPKDNAAIKPFEEMRLSSVELTIKNKTCTIKGKIVDPDSGMAATVTMKFCNVGKTKVDLPVVR